MIDIHNHIIFGLDDGAQTFEQTIDMVEMAYKDGIRAFIATPHYNRSFQYSMQLMEQNFTIVKDYFEKKYSEMKFYIGNECSLDENLSNDLVSQECKTLAGSYFVLIELSYLAPFSMEKRMLSDIIFKGYRPIIAHCERLIEEKADFMKIEKLEDLGCYFQVNASFFTSPQKRWKAKGILKCMENRTINFVSSDAHDPVYRKAVLGEAYQIVEKKIGKEIADEVFNLNAKHIILDGELCKPPQ